MKIIDPMPIFGDSGLRELKLTGAERLALRRAGAILEQIRAQARTVSATLDTTEQIVDVALAAYTCQELAQDGKVEL